VSIKFVPMKKPPVRSGVPFLNWHSRRLPAKICWIVRDAVKYNKWTGLYAFKACRDLHRACAKALKNTPEIYQLARATNMNRHSK
jgi:hypothetical protein